MVYRRGMTPNLGILSAMWRNYGLTVLERMLADRALKCDGGSLRSAGGACPACIMAPEVACIAGNNLLSRAAALGGGAPPGWERTKVR